jgi:metal-responsive CopG/Arc/MetJ family transcriptional regulator
VQLQETESLPGLNPDQIDSSFLLGYTLGMKTAVSLPETVFKEAERFARQLKKSRSQLYAEAIAEYLARHLPDAVTEAMNRVCDQLGIAQDNFATTAARKTLSSESW